MAFMKCYDVASMVLDEATTRFAPQWVIDKENNEILEEYCDAIDSLAEEFDGVSYDVAVDEVKKTVTISMECSDVTVTSERHRFFDLAERSVALGFSVSEQGNLIVEFVFPPIWTRKS